MKKVKKIYDSFLVKRKPPANMKSGDEKYFGGPLYEYRVPESHLYHIDQALVTPHGIIIRKFTALKEFIVCYKSDFKDYAYRYLLHIFFKFKRTRLNRHTNYLLVFDNYSGPKGFSHWLSDGLTRLVELNEILPQYTVLLPYYFRDENVFRETLKYFNIKNSYYIPKDSYVSVKNLFVANHMAESGNFHPENVLKLRKFVWEKTAVQKTKGMGERIYISRSKACRRFVTNEDEVTEILKKLDFTIINLEDFTFEKQVEIVYHAKQLVSIHGAALTHIHFMQTGANVLEFRKEGDHINGHFFDLADALDVNYYYQSCPAIVNSEIANNFDLTVDTSELVKNIESMLSGIMNIENQNNVPDVHLLLQQISPVLI